MKNSLSLKAVLRMAGIIAIVAVIGFSAVSCNNGSGGGGGGGTKSNTDPKTIVITGLKEDGYTYGNVGLFTAGTSLEDVQNEVGLTAGASYQNSDIVSEPTQITYPLYNPGTNSGRWKGNGTYDVYWFYSPGSVSDVLVLKASNVSFNEATTTVALSKFAEVK